MKKRGTREISTRSLQGQLAGNTATSSRMLYTYITVYAEETKPLAENASERQSVRGNRDEMTLVLALIGPSRWRHQEGWLFHPRICLPPSTDFLPAPYSPSNLFLPPHHLASSSCIANWCGRRERFRRSSRKKKANVKNVIISYTFSSVIFKF